MAKALKTIRTDFTPSPLQQAAIQRIHEYQEELKQYGYYVRSGMELEFMVKDSRGVLVPGVIKLGKAEEYLQNPARDMPLLRRFKTDSTAEYEIVVGDHVDRGERRASVTQFSPVEVARTTARLKEGELKRMLQESTCLSGGTMRAIAPFSPVFHAFPYSLASDNTLSQYENNSSALHINVSLYDEKGKNAFSNSDGLLKHCARSLVRVQDEAGLAFLPKNNSLKRLRPESHVSVPGGLGMETIPDQAIRKSNSSVNIRGGIYEVGGPSGKASYHHEMRIENRLPGADADPFVAMAVTLAAMVHAVRTYSREMDGVKNPAIPLTRSHGELVEKFETSRRMEKLLGPMLFNAILDEYGQTAEVTR
jgi:hypothetical protein